MYHDEGIGRVLMTLREAEGKGKEGKPKLMLVGLSCVRVGVAMYKVHVNRGASRKSVMGKSGKSKQAVVDNTHVCMNCLSPKTRGQC